MPVTFIDACVLHERLRAVDSRLRCTHPWRRLEPRLLARRVNRSTTCLWTAAAPAAAHTRVAERMSPLRFSRRVAAQAPRPGPRPTPSGRAWRSALPDSC